MWPGPSTWLDLGVVERDWYSRRNDYFYEQYKAGTLDIHEFLNFQLAPLAAHPPEQLKAWRDDFMATRIRPHLTTAAQALVDEHLEAGDLVAIVTATNTFVTAPSQRPSHCPPDWHRSRADPSGPVHRQATRAALLPGGQDCSGGPVARHARYRN